MKTYIPMQLLLILTYFGVFPSAAQNNHALHFDGVDDFVSITPGPIAGQTDFTFEAWISLDSGQTGSFKRFIGIGDAITSLEIGNVGNQFAFQVLPNSLGGSHITLPIIINSNIPTHLAVVRSGNDLLIYIDCILIFNQVGIFGTPINFNPSILLGRGFGNVIDQFGKGTIDEVKIWDHARSQAQINEVKLCGVSSADAGLLAYYSFDQGVANGNNPGESTLNDLVNSNNGVLNNFALTGPNSNWVNSLAPTIQPNLTGTEIEIRNYFDQSALLTEICNDDPAHFSLIQNGQSLSPPPNTNILWEYSDDGTTWLPLNNLPFSNNTTFPVSVGEIHIDCSTNSLGYIDRQYRNTLELIDPSIPDTCIYVTEPYDIRICCPIQASTVEIVPDDPACEGDTLNLSIQLNAPDLFVNTPGSVQIDWTSSDPLFDLTAFQNLLTFNTNYIVPPVNATTSLCITANITTACNKTASFSACIEFDPEPKCGLLEGKPQPPNLMLQSGNPNPVYTICRGDDATIGMVSNQDFENCIPTWEYSFDNISWTFLPEGSVSNPDLNTNNLPWDFFWNLGADRIFYRIQCNPLSDPSGCEPCYSDTLEIQLIDKILPPVILGPDELCIDDFPGQMNVQNPIAGLIYGWYFDSQFIGFGTSIVANEGGCYWVEAGNVCERVLSNIHCIESCEVIPVISCPLPPNDCACLGDPITLTAVDSEFNCDDNSNLVYAWTWLDANGNSQNSPNISITDIPPVAGTNYSLTVTDPIKNCSATTSLFIVPCDKN